MKKSTRLKVCLNHQYLQGSWNFECMQNGGWCYGLLPALKELYPNKEDYDLAVDRHLKFYNTHPYVSAPIVGIVLAMEEEKAKGADISDTSIQDVKIGLMGPLAGVGDPVFWFTMRPILGALGASLALSGNILGPILFFVLWNVIRLAFMWYTQEFGYRAGSAITDDLSGGLLQDVTKGASILGMFVLASLVQRWVNISFVPVVSKVTLSEGAYVEWDKIPMNAQGLQQAFQEVSSGKALSNIQETTLQANLDQLIPGLAGLLLTLGCMWLLKKKVSPIVIILGLFVVGILGHLIGIL